MSKGFGFVKIGEANGIAIWRCTECSSSNYNTHEFFVGGKITSYICCLVCGDSQTGDGF